jgi:glutamyl/glutaminyl-tRNA synthetase
MNHFGKMAMRGLSVESLLREYRAIFPQPGNSGADIDSDRAALIGELLPSCACKKELERSIGRAFMLNGSPESGEPADEAWACDICEELSLVAPEAWNSENVKNILKAFQKERNLKGKALYHFLRAKLTGAEHGAPIALIMGCLGKENALGRLEARKKI